MMSNISSAQGQGRKSFDHLAPPALPLCRLPDEHELLELRSRRILATDCCRRVPLYQRARPLFCFYLPTRFELSPPLSSSLVFFFLFLPGDCQHQETRRCLSLRSQLVFLIHCIASFDHLAVSDPSLPLQYPGAVITPPLPSLPRIAKTSPWMQLSSGLRLPAIEFDLSRLLLWRLDQCEQNARAAFGFGHRLAVTGRHAAVKVVLSDHGCSWRARFLVLSGLPLGRLDTLCEDAYALPL